MNELCVLLKKEVKEYIRKHKILIILSVFILIGIISPLGTKYLGAILQQLLPSGYEIKFRSPSEIEAYFQFFKNISQLGLIIFIFATVGIMSDEFEKKTIINILSKGINRGAVILSKFVVTSIIFLLSYTVSIMVFRYYTGIFWGNNIRIGVVIYSSILIYFYGVLNISVNIFLGTIFENKILTLVVCFAFNIIQMFLGIFPQIARYLPVSSLSQCVYIVEGKIDIYETIPALLSTLFFTALLLITSIYLFNRKEIDQ